MDAEQDYDAHRQAHGQSLRPGQLSYWQNYGKFHVSLMKAWFGKSATKENNWCYDWLPKLDMPGAGYDVLRYFDMMYQGKVNGYFCQGFNPIASFPNKAKVGAALREGAFEVDGGDGPAGDRDLEFWRNVGEYNDVDTASIKTTVFRLPTSCFAEEDGRSSTAAAGCSGTGRAPSRRARRVRTSPSWPGCSPPARDGSQGRRGLPDPILGLDWSYLKPDEPGPDELAREFNGKALERPGRPGQRHDPGQGRRAVAGLRPAARRRQHGERLLIFAGSLDPAATRWAAATTATPTAWARPSAGPGPGRRTGGFFNRASADVRRQAVGPGEEAPGVVERQVLGGTDVPGLQGRADVPPEAGMKPFIMNPEGVARLLPSTRWPKARSPSTTSRSRRRSG